MALLIEPYFLQWIAFAFDPIPFIYVLQYYKENKVLTNDYN